MFSFSVGNSGLLSHLHGRRSAVDGREVAMERHRRNQESIAEEMMGLARNLKENAIAAKTIIVNDNKVCFTISPEYI